MFEFRQSGRDLGDIIEAVEAFGDCQLDVATALAREAQSLVREGFHRMKDPDGQRWAPLRRPRAGGRILRRTERLYFTAARYTVDARGFVMEAVWYGGFHQRGVPGRLPRRAFYPDENAPLPLGWHIALSAAAEDALPKLPT